MYSILRYKYHDTPEGQDLCKKLFCSSKAAATVGIVAGITDFVFYSRVTKFTQRLNVVAAYVVPFVGYTAVFTTAVYVITNYRKNDYVSNYVLAGGVLSLVYGIITNNMGRGNALSSVIMPLLIIYKAGHKSGYNHINPSPPIREGVVTTYPNFSLVKDYPKNYTRGYI